MKSLDPKSGFARYASEYDKFEKYWDSFEQGKLTPYFREAKSKNVLDAGAGTGRLSLKLMNEGAHVTALDVSPDMLTRLKRKCPSATIVEGDVEAMPFADESFDMVFSSLTLVHLKKIEPFLDECYRVLSDGGTAVIVNIHYRKPLVLRDRQGAYLIECYNHFPRHVREAVEELAFHVEKELILSEEDSIWMSQILVLKK
ncbi:MAG: class I SAM-dependent methyltransferase [Candidatus Peregrinibacteria bacterium]